MTISDKINVILCILSFLLAAISIVIVVLTIRQNNKMIESSTRPYLTVYDNFTDFQHISYFLVLKNFGQSSAVIKKFSYDIDLSDCVDYRDARPPFQKLEGTTIAPGQLFISEINLVSALKKTDDIHFHIEYVSQAGKLYCEDISLNLNARTDNLIPKAATKGKEMEIMCRTLQDFVQKQL